MNHNMKFRFCLHCVLDFDSAALNPLNCSLVSTSLHNNYWNIRHSSSKVGFLPLLSFLCCGWWKRSLCLLAAVQCEIPLCCLFFPTLNVPLFSLLLAQTVNSLCKTRPLRLFFAFFLPFFYFPFFLFSWSRSRWWNKSFQGETWQEAKDLTGGS